MNNRIMASARIGQGGTYLDGMMGIFQGFLLKHSPFWLSTRTYSHRDIHMQTHADFFHKRGCNLRTELLFLANYYMIINESFLL